MKEFLLIVCVTILVVINGIYGNQIYDFFFEDKIIYSCKYEINLRYDTCNIAANLEKQRLNKLAKEVYIYHAKGDLDEYYEKKQNIGNNILRYRDYSCNPYRMDPINKEVTDYYKNLKYCRELYDDYKAFCGNYYKYCHHLSSYTMPIIYEMYQKLYK